MGQRCCCENNSPGLGGIVRSAKSQPQDQWMEEVLQKPSLISLHVQSQRQADTLEVALTSSCRHLRELLQVKGFIQSASDAVLVDGSDFPDSDLTLGEAGCVDGSTIFCREDARPEEAKATEEFAPADAGLVPPPPEPAVEAKEQDGAPLLPKAEAENGAWMVEVARASDPEGSKLGLVIYCREGEHFLRIRAIRPGLITEWNAKNSTSGKMVTKDTLIFSVNGIKDPKQCAEELSRATRLRLEMKDPPAS
mmetsp:Transcript_52975/g.98029  ORF Transcript_52975/g.98029 Transcript_52975/m.98029 type:complete len:251 (-) Transcript_52975:163-915(-)